jgi:plasmid segregation protein ParM
MSATSPTQTPFNIRGLDIGYGRTKFSGSSAGAYESFPSLAPPAANRGCDSHVITGRRTVEVWVDGSPYEVGPDTTLFASEVPVLHERYIETPQYRALFFGALDSMRLERIDLLVTGVPVHQFTSHAARLKELLTGTHTIRPGTTVEVVDVMVAIQPIGGLIAYTREVAGWEQRKDLTYLTIDPGYFTFDWIVTKGLNEIPGKSGSIPGGVSQYLTCVQGELSRKSGLYCHDLGRLDVGLRGGKFQMSGQEIDLQPFRARAEGVTERAVRAMCNRVDIGQHIDQIVLVGGGCEYFLPALQRTFPNRDIHVVKEPGFANVRGFHLFGRLISAKQGKLRKTE